MLRNVLTSLNRGIWRSPEPFTWLDPGRVAGGARPRGDRALALLTARGIAVLVNLYARPHDPVALARHGLIEVHLPVRDFAAPTPAQLDAGVAAIAAALVADRSVLVHCGAGLGRTGTLLACWLVDQGHTTDSAIARVRAARPGAIETAMQATAVADYARRYAPPGF